MAAAHASSPPSARAAAHPGYPPPAHPGGGGCAARARLGDTAAAAHGRCDDAPDEPDDEQGKGLAAVCALIAALLRLLAVEAAARLRSLHAAAGATGPAVAGAAVAVLLVCVVGLRALFLLATCLLLAECARRGAAWQRQVRVSRGMAAPDPAVGGAPPFAIGALVSPRVPGPVHLTDCSGTANTWALNHGDRAEVVATRGTDSFQLRNPAGRMCYAYTRFWRLAPSPLAAGGAGGGPDSLPPSLGASSRSSPRYFGTPIGSPPPPPEDSPPFTTRAGPPPPCSPASLGVEVEARTGATSRLSRCETAASFVSCLPDDQSHPSWADSPPGGHAAGGPPTPAKRSPTQPGAPRSVAIVRTGSVAPPPPRYAARPGLGGDRPPPAPHAHLHTPPPERDVSTPPRDAGGGLRSRSGGAPRLASV